jgi:hypothetical protein
MTENLHDPQGTRATQATGMAGLACLVALAALTVVGCSSSAEPTAVRASSAPTVTPEAAPAAQIASSAPTATVTVTPAPAPAPAPMAVAQPEGPAFFRSPSGNINCTLSTPGNEIAARCEVVDHTWTAPPPSDCHLNYGDRFYLTQAGGVVVGCYGQEFGPAPQETLGYGQSRTFGTITCDSEYTGMTCTDGSTGHYFRVSRDTYELG